MPKLREEFDQLQCSINFARPIKIQYLWLHWGLTDTAIRTKHMDKGTKCCTAIFHSFPLFTFFFVPLLPYHTFFSLLIILMLLQTANVLFLDAPVGAGFSYATTSEAWNASDTKLAAQAYQFLRNVSVIDDIYIYKVN